MSRLNPDIKTFEYGKRELKDVVIYPLSMADQSAFFKELLESYSEVALNISGMFSFAAVAIEQLHARLQQFLRISTDLDENGIADVVNNITNKQLMALADMVWKDNYEDVLKNDGSLSTLIRKLSGTEKKRPSQFSSNDTSSTTSPTYTDDPTETED